jgi:hypothetical protein
MTVLERVPVERIVEQARAVDLGRLLLAIVLAPLYAVGWLGGKALLALAVAGTTVKLGWQDARGVTGAERGPGR